MIKRASVFLLLLILFVSCTSYDDLLQEYDRNFVAVYTEESYPNVNDTGFSELNMIKGEYLLTTEHDFEVNAPYGGESYRWSIEGVTLSGSKVNGRTLHLYVDEDTFKAGKRYTLILEVMNSSGVIFTDSAYLYVCTKNLQS